MKKLGYFVKERNRMARYYNKKFSNYPFLKTPKVNKDNYCSYHLYPLRFDWSKIGLSKENFFNVLKKYGINLQIHYKPTYKFKYYKSKVKFKLSEFKNTEKFYNEVFSIPLYIGLKNKQLDYITETIIKNLKIKN